MDKRLAEDFDNHLKSMMLRLSQSVKEEQNRAKAILETKAGLLSICFQKLGEYFFKTDEPAGKILATLV